MRPWRKRWVIVLAGAIILVNVRALGIGLYLQHAATKRSWASDSRKSYAQIFGVSDEELARWFKSERFARLTKEPVPITFRRNNQRPACFRSPHSPGYAWLQAPGLSHQA
jgi:hypothetical protein